ncbi:MAG: hypothetical protein Fur0037_08820 [Planctomycetota bacterium]
MTWRRILILTASFLLLLAGSTWLLVRESDAAFSVVRAALRGILAADFSIDGADFDLGSCTVVVRGLEIRDPGRPAAALLSCAELRIAFEANPLDLPFSVRQVEIEGLAADLDLANGPMSLENLLRSGPSAKGAQHLPAVSVSDSRVRVVPRAGAAPIELDEIGFSVLPAAGPGRRSVLQGSARLADPPLPLQIHGLWDPDRGEAKVAASVSGAKLDARILERLRRDAGVEIPDGTISGDLAGLQLWLRARGLEQDHSTALGFSADIEHLACAAPAVPYPLRDACVQIAGSTDAPISFRVREPMDRPAVDVRGTIGRLGAPEPRIEIRGRIESLPVDGDLLSALSSFETGQEIAEALAPSAGTVDGEVYLRDPGGPGGLVEMDLRFREAALTYFGFGTERRIGFPLPLRRAGGTVRVRGGDIRLVDLKAQIGDEPGGGNVACSGSVTSAARGSSRVDLRISSDDLAFSAALRSSLDYLVPGGAALYDLFSPQGTAAVDVRIDTARASRTWEARLSPSRLFVAYDLFPYRVEFDRGSLVVDPAGVEIDLAGRSDENSEHDLSVRGHIAPDENGDFARGPMELRVACESTPIDDRLKAAAVHLLPEVRRGWEVLNPAGDLACDLVVFRPAGEDAVRYDLELRVRDAVARPSPLDLLIENVRGTIYAQGKGHEHYLDVDAVRGELVTQPGTRPAAIAVIGTMCRNRPIGADFTAVIRDLHIDPTLAEALDRIKVLNRKTFEVLRPSGVADCLLHWQQATSGAEPSARLTVQLRKIRSDAPMLPRPATNVAGDLHVEGGVVRFRDLVADIGDARLVCRNGHVKPTADGRGMEVAFQVSAERFPIDDDISRLVGGPFRQSILDRQFRGAVNVDDLSLTFVIPESGGSFATTVQGRLQAVDVNMLAGTRVEGIHGLIRIDESTIGERGGTIRGTIDKGSFRIFGHRCTDLATGFVADPVGIRLEDTSFSVHGGRVRNAGRDALAVCYVFPRQGGPPGTLSLDLAWDGIALSELLAESGWKGYRYRGSLLGELHIAKLSGTDLVNMQAAGSLAVVDGDLGNVPLFTAIYAQIAEPNRPRFESGTLAFYVADRIAHIVQLELDSSMMSVAGTGTLGMDGYLDVTLSLENLLDPAADVLIVPSLVKNMVQGLVRFHLFGYLRDLRAEQRWFTERDPKRTGLLPVPMPLEKPGRPDF